MRFHSLVAVVGVLFSAGAVRAQTALSVSPSQSADSLILLLDSTASTYTTPVLLDHAKADLSGCGKISKQVVLMLEVEKDGSVGNVRVASQSQNKCVTKAVLAAAHGYRFRPGQQSGKPAVTHIALAVGAEEAIAADGGRPIDSGKVVPPVLLIIVDPEYGLAVIKANLNARFRATFSIDTNGYVTNLRVVDAPSYEVEQIVSKAVKQDRFWPAMKDGKPVQVDLTMEFSLG